MTSTTGEPVDGLAGAEHGAGVSHVEPDDIGVALLTVIGALVAVVVVLIVVLLQAWFYSWKLDLTAERNGPIHLPAAEMDRLTAKWEKSTPGLAENTPNQPPDYLKFQRLFEHRLLAGDPEALDLVKDGKITLTAAEIAQQQRQRIETYGWVDRTKEIRAIPIDRAMELVATELAGEKSNGK